MFAHFNGIAQELIRKISTSAIFAWAVWPLHSDLLAFQNCFAGTQEALCPNGPATAGPAAQQALIEWLAVKISIEAKSEKTAQAYERDVLDFLAFLGQHYGGQSGLKALAKVSVSDMRAWMAQMRMSNVSPRSLARKLSAVKSFYRWFARREDFDATAILSMRAPKFQCSRKRRPVVNLNTRC